MISSLMAYDADGNVVATLDYLVARSDSGKVIGLVDFAAQEQDGKLREVWDVKGAVGSGTWPEWLGPQAPDFMVDAPLFESQAPDGTPVQRRGPITALVHKRSGHRRERAAIEAAVAAVEPNERGERDIRHLVGGPDRPLLLDEEGRTRKREPVTRPNLPIIGRER